MTQKKSKGHTYTNPRPGQYLKDAHCHIPGQWRPWIAVSMPLIDTGIDLIFYLIFSNVFFIPNNSIRGQCRFAVQQEALAARTAEMQIINEDMIVAVVNFIFDIFIVTYFLQLHWYFKWRIEAIANKPEKNFWTSTGFKPMVEGLKTQFFLGFICSCLNCNYHCDNHIFI